MDAIKRLTIVLAIVGTGVAVLGFGSLARAQEQSNEPIVLNVTPTVIELDANKGNSVSGSFKVVNGSDRVLQLTPTPKNFTASDEVGGVNITEDDTNYSVADWISVEPAAAELEARGSQIFEYTINVPSSAEPGGHFGAIIVNTEAVQFDQTGPAVVQEVGPLLLVRVPGDIIETAEIVEFSTAKGLYESGPVELITRVRNTGNVHFKPQGTIEIKNMFGQTTTTIDLDEQNVLPGTIRQLTDTWSPQGFSFGRYTAELTVIYGDNNEIAKSSVSFVIFPYKTILPIIIVLVVLITFLVRNRSRIRKALSVLKNG